MIYGEGESGFTALNLKPGLVYSANERGSGGFIRVAQRTDAKENQEDTKKNSRHILLLTEKMYERAASSLLLTSLLYNLGLQRAGPLCGLREAELPALLH